MQANIASSNVTSAQEHAQAVAEHLDANTTKELTERNKLVANDLTRAIAHLQNIVKSKPASTEEQLREKSITLMPSYKRLLVCVLRKVN